MTQAQRARQEEGQPPVTRPPQPADPTAELQGLERMRALIPQPRVAPAQPAVGPARERPLDGTAVRTDAALVPMLRRGRWILAGEPASADELAARGQRMMSGSTVIGGRDYAPIIQRAMRAVEESRTMAESDPEQSRRLRIRAQVILNGVTDMMAAHRRVATHGGREWSALGMSMHRAAENFLGTEAAERAEATLTVVGAVLDNVTPYFMQQNSAERSRAVASAARLSDASVEMSSEDVEREVAQVQRDLGTVLGRYQQFRLQQFERYREQLTLLSALTMSEAGRREYERACEQTDAIIARLRNERTAASVREEEMGEVARVVRTVEARNAPAALRAAGAPEGLVTAAEGAMALVSPSLTQRGAQVLDLVFIYLQNKDTLAAMPDVREGVSAVADLTSVAQRLATMGSAEYTAEVRNMVGGYIRSLRADVAGAREAAAARIERMAGVLQRGDTFLAQLITVEEGGSQELRESAQRLQEAAARMRARLADPAQAGSVTDQEFNNMQAALMHLQRNYQLVLRMPAGTDAERAARMGAATILANCAEPIMSGGSSDVAQFHDMLFEFYMQSADPAQRARYVEISNGIRDGTMTLGDARREIAGSALRDGDAAVARIGDPAVAQSVRGFLDRIREHPEQASAQDIIRARQAIGIANAAVEVVQAGTEGQPDIRRTAMGIVNRALEALGLGYQEAAMAQLQLAREYVQHPDDREAIPNLSASLRRSMQITELEQRLVPPAGRQPQSLHDAAVEITGSEEAAQALLSAYFAQRQGVLRDVTSAGARAQAFGQFQIPEERRGEFSGKLDRIHERVRELEQGGGLPAERGARGQAIARIVREEGGEDAELIGQLFMYEYQLVSEGMNLSCSRRAGLTATYFTLGGDLGLIGRMETGRGRMDPVLLMRPREYITSFRARIAGADGAYISEGDQQALIAVRVTLFGDAEQGVPGLQERIGGLRGRRRSDAEAAYQEAFYEICTPERNAALGIAFLSAAELVARTADDTDRTATLLLQQDLRAGNITIEQYEERLTLYDAKLRSMDALRGVEGLSPRDRQRAGLNLSSYYDLAIYALQHGQRANAETILRMAGVYLEAVRAKAGGGDTAAADQTIEWVHGQLGDMNTVQDVARRGRRFSAFGVRGAETTSDAGVFRTGAAWRPDVSRLPGTLTRVVLGGEDTEQAAAERSAELRSRMDTYRVSVGLASTEARLDRIARTPARGWAREHDRLEGLARTETRAAERLNRQADQAEARGRDERARTLRAQAEERAGRARQFTAQAALVDPGAMFGAPAREGEPPSPGMVEATRQRARQAYERIGELQAAAAEREAAGDVAGAQRAMEEADALRQEVDTAVGGLERYNTSVMRVNTPWRERGREQLWVGLGILRGLWSGQDVDERTGQPLEGGEAPGEERAAVLRRVAFGNIGAGRQEVDRQLDIQRRRDSTVAGLRRQRERAEIITRPAEERAAALEQRARDAEAEAQRAEESGEATRAEEYRMQAQQFWDQAVEVRRLGVTADEARAGGPSQPQPMNIEVDVPSGTAADGSTTTTRRWAFDRTRTLGTIDRAIGAASRCDFASSGNESSRAQGLMATGQVALGMVWEEARTRDYRQARLGADENDHVDTAGFPIFSIPIAGFTPAAGAGAGPGAPLSFDANSELYDPNRRIADSGAALASVFAIQDGLAAGRDVRSSMVQLGQVEEGYRSDVDREQFYIGIGAARLEAQRARERARSLTYVPSVEEIMRARGIGRGQAMLERGRLLSASAEERDGARLVSADMERVAQSYDRAADQSTHAFLLYRGHRDYVASARNPEADAGLESSLTGFLGGGEDERTREERGRVLSEARAALPAGQEMTGSFLYNYLYQHNPEMLAQAMGAFRAGGAVPGGADAFMANLAAEAEARGGSARRERNDPVWTATEFLLALGRGQFEAYDGMEDQLGTWRRTGASSDLSTTRDTGAEFYALADAVAGYIDDPEGFRMMAESRTVHGFRRQITMSPVVVSYGTDERRVHARSSSGVRSEDFMPYLQRLVRRATISEAALTMGGISLLDFSPTGRRYMFTEYDYDGESRPYASWPAEERAYYQRMRATLETAYNILGVRPVSYEERMQAGDTLFQEALDRNPQWAAYASSDEMDVARETYRRAMPLALRFERSPRQLAFARAAAGQLEQGVSMLRSQMLGVASYRREWTARAADYVWGYGAQAVGYAVDYSPGIGSSAAAISRAAGGESVGTGIVAYGERYVRQTQERPRIGTEEMFGAQGVAGLLSTLGTTAHDVSTGEMDLGTAYDRLGRGAREFQGSRYGERLTLAGRAEIGLHQRSTLAGVDFVEDTLIGLAMGPYGFAYWGTLAIAGSLEQVHQAGGFQYIGTGRDETAFYRHVLGMSEEGAQTAAQGMVVGNIIVGLLPIGAEARAFSLFGRAENIAQRAYGVVMLGAGLTQGAVGLGQSFDWEDFARRNPGESVWSGLASGRVRVMAGASLFAGVGNLVMGPAQILGARALAGRFSPHETQARIDTALGRGDLAGAARLMRPSFGRAVGGWLMGQHSGAEYEAAESAAHHSYLRLRESEQAAVSRIEWSSGEQIPAPQRAQLADTLATARRTLEISLGAAGPAERAGRRVRPSTRADIESYVPGDATHPLEAVVVRARQRRAAGERLSREESAALAFVESPITQERFVMREEQAVSGYIGRPAAEIPPQYRQPVALAQEMARANAQRRAGGASAEPTARDYEAAVHEVARISVRAAELRSQAADPASPVGRYIALIAEPRARELADGGMSPEAARAAAREEAIGAVSREAVLRGRVGGQVGQLDAAQSVAFAVEGRQPPLGPDSRAALVESAQRVQRWMSGQEPIPPQYHQLVTEGMARISRGEDARRVLATTSDAVRTWENTHEQRIMREYRIRAGQEMLNAPGVSFSEASGRYTIAYGGVELRYSRFSIETARDVVIGAERVVREGADPARIFPDNPIMQEAVRRLAQDQRFLDATGQPGQENRGAQLRFAMERVSAMPEAIAREESSLGATLPGLRGMAQERRARAERLLDFERNPVQGDERLAPAQRQQRIRQEEARRRAEAGELSAQADAFDAEVRRREQYAARVASQAEPIVAVEAGARGLNEPQLRDAQQRARALAAAFEDDAALVQLPLSDQRFVQRMRIGERASGDVALEIARRAAMEGSEVAMADAMADAISARPGMSGEQAVRAYTIEEAFGTYREMALRGTPTEQQLATLKATYSLSDANIESFSQWIAMPRERVAGEIADLAMGGPAARAAPGEGERAAAPQAPRTHELGGMRITALDGEARAFENFEHIVPQRMRDMAARRRAMAAEAESGDATRAAALRREAAALDAEAQARQARAPGTRRGEAARRADFELVVSSDELLAVMRERAGRSGDDAWTVGGREADMGTILRSIEDSVLTMAQGGRDSDVLIFSGDKSLLNAINNLFGEGWGDIALAAYREIVRLALAEVTREGEATYFMRPSPRGDETITVVVLRPNRGEQVRSRMPGALARATERVLYGADSPFAEAFRSVSGLVVDPSRLVAATLATSRTIRVRGQEGGRVEATYSDGQNAFVQREGGRREFLTHAATAADDPAFAGPLRQALHVEESPNRRPAILGRETGVVEDAWSNRAAPRSDADRAIISRTEEVLRANGVADPESATPRQIQEAIRTVASERAVMSDAETVSVPSVAFEIRLSVTDPGVLAQIESYLPQAGKGAAEVFNNIFGIRAINTFLGHDGANAAINFIDALVVRYASEHGLRIRELGTMKYIIEGGTPEQIAGLYRYINEQIRAQPEASRFGFEVSERSPVIPLGAGTSGETARTHVSNGHMVVERRGPERRLPPGWSEAQARATDWDGETQRYADANALISAFNSRMATEPFLRTLLGDRYEALRPIIDIIRARSDLIGSDAIRNFEDLVFALRDPRIGGEMGRALEGAFRSFVVEHGAEFRARLAEAVPTAPRMRRRAGEEASEMEMRLAAGMGAPEPLRQAPQPRQEAGRPALRLVPREGGPALEEGRPEAASPERRARGGRRAAPRIPEVQRMESEVGAIPSERADAVLSDAQPEVQRVGRALDSMVRRDAVLTEAQVRADPSIRRLIERYPEYEDAIITLYAARPEERPLLLRDAAGEIVYRRGERSLEAALALSYPDEASRNPDSATLDPVVAYARAMLRAKHGQHMSHEELAMIRFEHFDLLDQRLRSGMTEAAAILSVAREVAGPEPRGPPTPAGGPGGRPRLRLVREGEGRAAGGGGAGRAPVAQRTPASEPPGPRGLLGGGEAEAAPEGVASLAQRRQARADEETARRARAVQETLVDPDAFLDFARQVANDETVLVGQERVRARTLLGRMDVRVQGEIHELGALNPESDFAQAARRRVGTPGDFAFRRYGQRHQADIEARAQRIHSVLPQEAEAQAAAAVPGAGAEPAPAVGTVVEGGGIRPGSVVAMAGSFVSPSRLEHAMGVYRSAEGGGQVAPEAATFVAQVRQRMRERGISADQAVADVLEHNPPASRQELGKTARDLFDAAEAHLSGDLDRRRSAQERYLAMSPLEQEAFIYMITPGSEYYSADPAMRLRNAERMGRSIELEAAGDIAPISEGRLRMLAGIADRYVYDGIETDLGRIIPPMNAAEARALGRFGLVMEEAKRRNPQMRAAPESYIPSLYGDRLMPDQQQRAGPAARGLTPREEGQLARISGLQIEGRTPWRAVRGEEREMVLDEVLQVYAQAYGRAGLLYHEPRQLLGRMDIIYTARDSHGEVVGFATFSQTPDGLRLGLVGALPRNAEGRAAVREMLRAISQMDGVYGNVSAAVANILINEYGMPIVPFAQAQRRMGGRRGGGANAVRDADALRTRMGAEAFEASPIVQRAMERSGKSAAEITFDDLVDAAAHPREDSSGRVTALAEIPDTPEARANCFALVQNMEGPDGRLVPTIEVKLMVGRPGPEPQGGGAGQPGGAPPAPAPRGGGPEQQPQVPAQRPPYEVGPRPEAATRARGPGTAPRDAIGMENNDPYFAETGVRYNGIYELGGQRFVEFTLRNVEGEPRVRIFITDEIAATSGDARKAIIHQRLAAARESPVTPELPAAPREAPPAPRAPAPEQAPEAPAPAQRPLYEVGPRPEGASQVKGAGATPMDVIGMQPGDQYFRTNRIKYNGLFEVNGQRFAEFTLQGAEGQPRVRIPITDEVAATSGDARRQLIEQRLNAALASPTTPELPAAPAPAPARAELPAAPAERPAFEIGPRPEGASQVKGAGATPMDVMGMQPGDQYFRTNRIKYNGLFEAGGERFAEYTLLSVEGQPRVRISLPEESALASAGITRRQYFEQHLDAARARAASGEGQAPRPAAPAAPAPAEEARPAQAPAGREVPVELVGRSLRDEDIQAHENMERLLLGGSSRLSPEVSALLPQGEYRRPVFGIALMLEQLAGRDPAAVAPEYRDAVRLINSRTGTARAEEIARQAQAIFEARGGALGYSARRMVDGYVEGGTPRDRATRAVENALQVPGRFGREGYTPRDATDSFIQIMIDDAAQRNPGRPREVVALEVGRDLAAASAGIMRRSRPDGVNWVRPADAGEALAYNIAWRRAEAQGRTQPIAEDFMFGTAAIGALLTGIRARGMEHLAAECIRGMDTLTLNTPSEQLPGAISAYLRAGEVIARRIPATAIGDAEHRDAVASLFNFAAYMRSHGVEEPALLLANPSRSGLLDIFPIGSPADVLTLGGLVVQAADVGKDIVRAGRGEMIAPTLRLLFEDAARLNPDARQPYLQAVAEHFEWSDALGQRITDMDAKSGASARRKRLPMLAYMAGPEFEPIIAALDNSSIRNRLSTDSVFREFVRFLDNLRNADLDVDGQAWLEVVREHTRFLGMSQEERGRRGVGEDVETSRISFITDRIRHLNTLYSFHREGKLPPGMLRQISETLTGNLTTEQFSAAMGRGYQRLVPELHVPEAWVLQNLDMFAEIVAYRRTLGFLADKANIFPDYVGTREMFTEGLRIFDQALMAHIGGRFAEFKFSPEFRQELVSSAQAAGLDGEAIFRTWSSEHTFTVTAAGAEHEVRDTGAFDAGFYSGMVRGATACQSPRNMHPVVGGIIGMVTQPWMRQIVIGPPGSPEATYRRWMTLVRGDDGRPILLLQPAYQLPGTPPEVDRAVVAAVRQRYEALGIEVREVRGSIDEQFDASGRPLNRGYSTYTFRSPFVYMDSNMREILFSGRRAQNGLVTAPVGGSVSFPPGSRLSTTR